MKRYIKAALDLPDTQELVELSKDMLYQVWDNNKYNDFSEKDILDDVVEHVALVILEMDEDGNYAQYKAVADKSKIAFKQMVRAAARQAISEDGNQYEWN